MALRTLAASAAWALTAAYNNGAPGARLPPMGWSSWIALGPGAGAPIFDYCDEAGVKASIDAFIALGFPKHGW